MREIHAKQALIGENLELEENISIYLDDNNTIMDIDNHKSDSNLVVVPAFFNAHVHAADIALRNQVGSDLNAVVGPGGTKHRYLKNLTQEQLINNIEQSITEAKLNGILGYADFREGGLKGSLPYQDFPSSFIPFGRPTAHEIDDLPPDINVGIRDVTAYSLDTHHQLVSKVHSMNGIIQIHVSEDEKLRAEWIERYGVSDLYWAIDELLVDTVVHATLATKEDTDLLAQTKTGVVVCPSSNRYFNIGIPPVEEFLSNQIPVGLGSDNAMINPVALWKEFRILTELGIPSFRQLHMATIGGASTAGIDWGIERSNSHLLIFDIPSDLSSSSLFSLLTDPKIMKHLSEIITPTGKQSHN